VDWWRLILSLLQSQIELLRTVGFFLLRCESFYEHNWLFADTPRGLDPTNVSKTEVGELNKQHLKISRSLHTLSSLYRQMAV
jgi:hypothetical protein